VFGSDSGPEELAKKMMATPPSETCRFLLIESRVRLLVGADDGSGRLYGFAERAASPGEKQCRIWYSEEAQVVALGSQT
jgi:hypothetical protein